MLDYTSKIEQTTIMVPKKTIVKENHTVIKDEPCDVDLLNITMLSRIRQKKDLEELSERLYPEIRKTMSWRPYLVVSVKLEEDLRFVVQQDFDEIDIKNALLREYAKKIELPRMLEADKDNNHEQN